MLPNRMNDVVRSILAGGIATIVAVAAVFTTLSVTTLATSTLKVGSGGATSDGVYRATLSLDPASIAAGGTTTTNVTVTGAVVGDHCSAARTAGDIMGTTSTLAGLPCSVTAADTATVYMHNATSTAAFNAGMSTISVKVDSY